MPSAARFRAILLAVAAGTAAASQAESGPLTSSDYRLSTRGGEAYRLAGAGAPAPAGPSAIPPQLADKPFAELIHKAAREAALDPALVHAVIHVESGYNPAARSPKGALGLMQVLPGTAARYGVADPARTVEANLRVGTRYLRDLMGLFDNRLELALAAYNAGENAVIRHRQRIPPYRETQLYVPAVLDKYREWQEPQPAAARVRKRVEYLPGTLLDAAAKPSPRP